MTSFIAPAIRQLICALRTHPDSVDESSRAATLWLGGCQESLRLLRPLILWSDSTEELLNQADLDLREALRLVADRHTAPADKADALGQAMLRYYGQLFQLQNAEGKRPAFSPVLSLDQLIKVAFNLIQGKCERFELQTRFPLAHADILNLRSQWQMRKAIFEDVAWPPEIQEHLNQIEGGMGAMAQYLESGTTLLLEESIQLLGKGSTDYAQWIQSSQPELQSKFRFGRHDAIECWLRLQEHPYDLGAPLTQQAWDRLFNEVDAFQRSIQMARRAGLAIVHPDLVVAAGGIHQQALDRLTQVATQTLSAQAVADLLNPAWDQMDNFRSALQAGQATLQAQFEGAPRMLELVEILGQCQAGVLPHWVLQDEVNQRLEQQKASLKALQEAPQAPESMASLLMAHEQAYQRILLYCQDEQLEHLVEGWKLLAMTMPPLIAYETHLRQELAKTGRSGQQVTCIRCGQVQIPQKTCGACGAALPQMQIDDVRYQDISGGEAASQGTPVDVLADLVEGLAFGTCTWDQVVLEMVSQLKNLEKTRERFEREMVKIMGREDALDAYCQFFVVRMGQLSTALAALGEAAQARQLATMKAGLSAYRQLHEELIEFQKKIGEGMAKLSQ